MWKERIIVNINDVNKFNLLLKQAFQMPSGVVYGDPKYYKGRKGFAFIWQTDVRIWVSFASEGKVRHYNFRLDGELQSPKTAMNIYKDFSRYYKVRRYHQDKEHAPFSASPFMYYNPEYEGKRVNAIGYDLNSAYGNAVLKADFPNTNIVKTSCEVGPNEIGFDMNGNVIRQGFAVWVFPIMTKEEKQPIIDYFTHWWQKKKEAKTPEEKKDAKDHLNIVVGYWQKYNCFMRAAVVSYVNDYIRSIINERDDVLYCNTDSIVCLNPINELELGTELGQWKIEHEGDFAYIGYNYQWNKNSPAYRGISKAWFKKDYDILTDGIPTEFNVYEYDKNKRKVVKIKNED